MNRKKFWKKINGSPKNVAMHDMETFLNGIAPKDGQRGSHVKYKRDNKSSGERDFNLQPTKDGKCKPYQVRQVMDALKDDIKNGVITL